ncbi:MAG: hypothetical protein FWE08_07115 [Oscillospiraceae bacterium]|nr:hypothetical protein [Oscillospiraceae bacterium]
METQTRTQAFKNAQEARRVRKKLVQAKKRGRNAVFVMMILAAANVLYGAAAVLFLDDGNTAYLWGPGPGIGFLAVGLIFLGFTIGIHRRNRVCAIAAAALLGADTAAAIAVGEFGDWGIVDYLMRGVLVFGAILGLIVCFKYHALRKAHKETENEEIYRLMRRGKPRIKPWQKLVYFLIACIGVGALVYGVLAGIMGQEVYY